MSELKNKLQHLVEGQIPEYLRASYPRFALFIKEYYTFLDGNRQANAVLLNSNTWSDVDLTLDLFVEEMRKQHAYDISPEVLVDQRRLIKFINQYYESKGSENAAELYFRMMYNDTATVKYPGDYVLRAFDGVWSSKKTVKIEDATRGLAGKLIIKEYPPKRASLDDIERHLDQLWNQHNFKPDVIFIDYLDLLKNRQRARNERKDDLDDIYTDAKGLAKELGIPIVSPSQVNRSGAADKVVEGDKAAGSYDKIMIGDIIISTSRLRKDKVDNTSRWHIIKNRYGTDGITFNCDFEGSTGITRITGEYIEDEESDSPQNSPQRTRQDFDHDDKDYLRKKFFELATPS